MRIVLDTNVLVSGLLSATGPPGWIVEAVLTGDLDLAIDMAIREEYEEVLKRPGIRLSCGPEPHPDESSALDGQHGAERVHDFDQVRLRRHHQVEVLVGARDLVEDALVLAALDALGLFREVREREAALRLAA